MIVRKAAELLRWISRWTKLPVRGILNILVPFLWNQLMYFGAKIIAGGWIHYDLSLPMDAQIPFVPWTVLIYFSWIVYWLGCDYVLVRYSDDAEKTDRFFGADVIAKTICFCIFLAFPTTNARKSRDMVCGICACGSYIGWIRRTICSRRSIAL